MFEAQGHKCACCGSTEPNHKKGWQLDHDHETGENRGIVCGPCNTVLGLVRDSVEHLEKLKAYLKSKMKVLGAAA